MSIFGTSRPKVEYGVGPTTVEIDYCIIEAIEPIIEAIKNVSKIGDGVGHYERGSRLRIKIKVNLWKETSPGAKYSAYYALKNEDLTFYLHRDSGAIDDNGGTPVTFRMTEFKSGYLTQNKFEDILYMTFESLNYVDLESHIKP